MIIGEVEENRILDEFKKLVKDLEQDDATLRRFLRARNHDLIKAEDMLRKAIEWRTLCKVDDALNWIFDDAFVKEFPIDYPGVDYNDRAVMYMPVGAWHIRAMIEKGNKEQMIQYIYTVLEKLTREIEKTGEQFTMIIDLDGMTYWKIAHYETCQMTLKVFRDFEANYPERLGEALVINVPLVLNYVWPLIKPLLTGSTLSKVKFLGTNPAKFMPILLERMPPSTLPETLRETMKKKNIVVKPNEQAIAAAKARVK